MQTKSEIDFYNEIIVAAKMGIQGVDVFLPKCQNARLKKELLREKAEFTHIQEEVTKELLSAGGQEKDVPFMLDFWSKISGEVSYLMNKTGSHIAEKLMNGNLMGIIGVCKTNNKFKNANSNAKKFASMFIDACERNIKLLKTFL